VTSNEKLMVAYMDEAWFKKYVVNGKGDDAKTKILQDFRAKAMSLQPPPKCQKYKFKGLMLTEVAMRTNESMNDWVKYFIPSLIVDPYFFGDFG